MISAIHNKKDYKEALSRIYNLMQMDIKKDSEEYSELKVLSILTENYEEDHFPVDLRGPNAGNKLRIDLEDIPGS